MSKILKLVLLSSGVYLALVLAVSLPMLAQDPSPTIRERIVMNEGKIQNNTDRIQQQERRLDELTNKQNTVMQDIAVLKAGQETISRLLWAIGLGMIAQIVETFYSNVIRRGAK